MFKKLKSLSHRIKKEITVYKLLLNDERTPRSAKILLGIAIGYFFMPFDLIPDFIPVIGHIDDVIIIPSLILLALKIIPKELHEECRKKVEEENKHHS